MTANTQIYQIVGTHFRIPGKVLVKCLPTGQRLSLRPEPENPYDPKAMMVMLDPGGIDQKYDAVIDEQLQNTGFDLLELRNAGEPIHLGYIPDSDGKLCSNGEPGNREIGIFVAEQGLENLSCSLGFSLEGKPTISVSVIESPVA